MTNSLPSNWHKVEYKTLLKEISTNGLKIKKKETKTKGRYPVIDQGQQFIGGYTDEESKLIKVSKPVIIFGDHTRTFKYVDFDFVPGADGVKILQPIEGLNPKLFYYFSKIVRFKNRGYSRHYQFLKKSEFNLPPASDQQKIVDKIEELFSVIDEQSKQMATMKKQANLIRQALLQAAVTGKLTPFSSVEKNPLKKLGQWTGGGTPSKSVKEYWSSGNIPWVSPKDMKSRFISDTQDKISKKAVENSSAKLIKTGSLLIVTRSGILRRTLPVAVTKVEATVNQDIKALTPNENTILGEYLLILFEAFNNEIRHKCSKSGTTVESIEYPTLLKYEVEYPGIDEQKQVIQLINEFESVLLSEEKALTETKQLANQLKQSILKQAFEGKLV